VVRITKILIFILLLSVLVKPSFAKQSVLAGGDTDRAYVIDFNVMVGVFGLQLEGEMDIRINESVSIAPRGGVIGLALTDGSLFSGSFVDKGIEVKSWPAYMAGISARFAVIKGVRPHGFWVGPSMDVIFGFYRESNMYGLSAKKLLITFTPSAEFGWRYTFSFGLSFQALVRFGLWVDTGQSLGFYGIGGVGIGYSF
jgi:hypothetical protein